MTATCCADRFARAPNAGGPDLRPERAADRPFLLKLYRTTREAELTMTPWDEQQKSAFIEFQFHAQDSHYRQFMPATNRQIVKRAGQRLGRLYVDRRAGEIRLVDISLMPQERGQGVGSSLLRQLMDEARHAALPLTIHVEQHNRALGLYRRLGFRCKGHNGVYQLMQWEARPHVATEQ